jgi:phage gpG-like protein
MITISISSNAAAVLQKVRSFPAKMAQAVAKALDRRNELTVGQIQATKLSRKGPTTLGVVTNRLRSSVRPALAQVASDTRIVSAIGSNVKYAGAHEYGFTGSVPVKAHTRKVTQVFGRELKSPITAAVKAHPMKMNVAARAPISTGITEQAPKYSADISRAILSAWEGAAA